MPSAFCIQKSRASPFAPYLMVRGGTKSRGIRKSEVKGQGCGERSIKAPECEKIPH